MTDEFHGPSARGFDWEHIFERHSEAGGIVRQSGVKTVFVGLTETQIKGRVKAARRKRKRIRSQSGPLGIERILYSGTDPQSRQVMQFWYNVKTQMVETAYPVKAKQ